jgi:acetyltransferase-like isoleucine patch superfamily enzyme
MTIFDETTNPVLRAQILSRYVGELMTDSERARFYGLPEGCRIRERTKILAPERFTCGRFVYIGEGGLLDAQGGLEIGDYTQLAAGVTVLSHTSHRQALAGDTGKSRGTIRYLRTRIGERCFIGGPSVIGPGVTIGNGCIVQPLTFVSQDLPDGTIYGTNRQVQDLTARVEALESALRQRGELAGLTPK